MTEAITESDLRDHFEKFGSVTDVYVPKPFRSFAFVSFREAR
jgi:RNA recognition motif-containing protein